jgi:phospholipid-binding lipoprotein MlaA
MGLARCGTSRLRSSGIVVLLVLLCAGGVQSQETAEQPDPLFDDFFEDDLDREPIEYPDPLERTNRGVFAFNRQVDRWILDPITRAYRFAVPTPVRNAIGRFFLNLNSTKTIVNDLLQLEWVDAGVSTSRLVINTTIGIAGFFDVADRMGLRWHDSDFGQTLALAGTPSGPYVILPVLGPSTIRDGIGTGIDGFFQPTFYILGPGNFLTGPAEILIYSGTSGITTRDRHFSEMKALQDSSIDYYAALRSGYYQDRIAQIWGRREGHRTFREPGLWPNLESGPDAAHAIEIGMIRALSPDFPIESHRSDSAFDLPLGFEIRDLGFDRGDELLETLALERR